MVRPTVNSIKHVVQIPFQDGSGLGTILNTLVANVVDTPDRGIANQVEQGCTIKAVYVELWITNTSSTASGATNVTVEKKVGGANNMSFAQSQDLHGYVNKRNIFYMTQGLTPADDTNPAPFIRQWIAIPKGKQRFTVGDEIRLNVSSITDAQRFCGVIIYKEYY